MISHTGFQSTSARRLDRESVPMRLWRKSKKLGIWDPEDIDFTQDRLDWLAMSPAEQDLLLRLTALFQSGEEAVTLDLLPLISVMAAEGRLEEEMYLTSFLWEEAKHVDAFNCFLNKVTHNTADLSAYHGPCYRRMFYELLPEALLQLRADPSPLAQARASVTYNLIVEGVLAESGYHGYLQVMQRNGVLPGMQQVIGHLKRDESRHLAYGVYLLSRLVAEHGEPVWEVIQTQMTELLPTALGMVEESLACYAVIPFGLTADEFLNYATMQFQNRYVRIEQARTLSLEELRTATIALDAQETLDAQEI